MTSLTVGVRKETGPGERRVALVPDGVSRLVAAGHRVLVEAGAGAAAWSPDAAYAEAGAEIVSQTQLTEKADVVLSVGRPEPSTLRSGQLVLGLLQPRTDPDYVAALAERGVTAVSLDGLPRTLSRAQTMDALSSQASVAGYQAVLVAAQAYPRYFPLLITAAGTARPAQVLVLGAGVAGLQAVGTARRLGAVVRAYDVRPAARGEIESLGGSFLELTSVTDAAGEGGYARALTPQEQEAQQRELGDHVAGHDVVITTAQVPGRRPPLLVTAETVAAMRPGSVIVDLAASPLGGNVAGSEPGATRVTDGGVTVIGADSLPSSMPAAASAAYSRNIGALLVYLVGDDGFALDLDDEIHAGVVVTHQGKVLATEAP